MRRMPQIAHVDVNCFYASAEWAFNPALEGLPVILLSNYVPRNIIRVVWPVWLCGPSRRCPVLAGPVCLIRAT
ncbi:hypothetical protein ABIB45_004548 [Arthrobacter sp. UYCo732]